MKRVAIVAPQTLPVPPVRGGGIQNGIAEIIKHIAEYEVHVISAYIPDRDPLPPFERNGNIAHHRLYLPEWRKNLIRLSHLSFNFHYPYAWATARVLNELEPDIVHVRSRLWMIPYYRKLLRFPHTTILHHHNHYFCDMSDCQVKRYMDMVDAFVGVSDYTVRTEVTGRFPGLAAQCFAVHNGIDTDRFVPREGQKDANMLARLGLSTKDTLLLFVGRISPDKGVHTLLEAMQQAVRKFPEIKLLVVGSSWFGENAENDYTRKLKKLSAPIRDNVVFTGFVNRSDILSYYQLADLFIAPSVFQDPSPNTCYEASAVGLPLIASGRGGIPEIVDDGKTGILLSDPEDPQELYRDIVYFMENQHAMEAMGRAARKRMIERFTWKHAARKTELIYGHVLSRRT